jgi:hypothetical protein
LSANACAYRPSPNLSSHCAILSAILRVLPVRGLAKVYDWAAIASIDLQCPLRVHDQPVEASP